MHSAYTQHLKFACKLQKIFHDIGKDIYLDIILHGIPWPDPILPMVHWHQIQSCKLHKKTHTRLKYSFRTNNNLSQFLHVPLHHLTYPRQSYFSKGFKPSTFIFCIALQHLEQQYNTFTFTQSWYSCYVYFLSDFQTKRCVSLWHSPQGLKLVYHIYLGKL